MIMGRTLLNFMITAHVDNAIIDVEFHLVYYK